LRRRLRSGSRDFQVAFRASDRAASDSAPPSGAAVFFKDNLVVGAGWIVR
jgi:hypothetical protein